MANLNNTITVIGSEYRPCIVDGEKALFHRWSVVREVVPPSNLRGGHNGGEIEATLAIVEYSDGNVATVSPERIKFIDNKISEYHFPDPAEKVESL